MKIKICITIGAIDPIGLFNPAPIYRQMSIPEAFSNLVSVDAPENQDVALRRSSAPCRQHIAQLQEVPFGPWPYDPEALPKLLHFYFFALCPECG